MRTAATPIGTNEGRKASQIEIARFVAHGILSGLELGEILPGQRLVEADLCLRFGAGRQPVRIALQELAGRGVVEITPNRGAAIARLDVDEGIKTLEVTEILFDLAARSAARNIAAGASPDPLPEIAEEFEEALSAGGNPAFVAARRRFFGAIGEVSGNPELARLISQVRVHVLRAQFGFAAIWRRHARELGAISGAVLAGDERRAGELCRAHIQGVREHLEQQR